MHVSRSQCRAEHLLWRKDAFRLVSDLTSILSFFSPKWGSWDRQAETDTRACPTLLSSFFQSLFLLLVSLAPLFYTHSRSCLDTRSSPVFKFITPVSSVTNQHWGARLADPHTVPHWNTLLRRADKVLFFHHSIYLIVINSGLAFFLLNSKSKWKVTCPRWEKTL